jgi:hypothetical protein
MCKVIQVQGWACGCQIRPDHRIPAAFIKECIGLCRQPHTMPAKRKIPWFCPQCHDAILQNRVRPLYGLTGSTSESVLNSLDQLDNHRLILRGADMGILNTLETNLKRLEQDVLLVARQLNQARDTALESFLGTALWRSRGWEQIQKSGQEYVFLEPGQTGVPAMLTKAEKLVLPSYEDNLIPSPYPRVEQSGQSEEPPSYLEVIPYNLLGNFEPHDCDANAGAVNEGDSSVSSDFSGDYVTPIDLLTRLRKKMYAEFAESRRLESRGFAEDQVFSYTLAEQAQHGVLAFGTAYRRRSRRQQLRHQMKTASYLIFEETAVRDMYQRVMMLQIRISNGAPDIRGDFEKELEVCGHVVHLVYMNRYRYSLSNLLVPRSGTDTSRAHAINLMPDTQRTMFSARSLGFPEADTELIEYTNQPLMHYWEGRFGPHSFHPFDMALVNPDTDGEGNVKSYGDFKPTKTPPRQENGFVRSTFRPVDQLSCVVLDQDPAKPRTRLIRTRQNGISFVILMPGVSNGGAPASSNAGPLRGSVPTATGPARTSASTAGLQISTVTENRNTQTGRALQALSSREETFSLAGVLSCLRIRHEESRDIELAEAQQYFGLFFLGLVLTSAPILMRLDRRQQGPLGEDITALSNATGTGLAATSLRNL